MIAWCFQVSIWLLCRDRLESENRVRGTREEPGIYVTWSGHEDLWPEFHIS